MPSTSQPQQPLENTVICPITHELMTDPVLLTVDGRTYERSAIEEWIRTHGTSPVTREPATVGDLVPNRAVRDVIESLKNNPGGEEGVRSAQQEAVEIVQEREEGVEEEGVEVSVVATQSLVTVEGREVYDALVKVAPPDGTRRSQLDVCCVIDISGSMGEEVVIKTAEGSVERDGLSILDIVKHAVKTIIHTLNPTDRLALVSFSNSGRKELPLTTMNDDGKRLAMTALERLEPSYSTNLWDGLKMGLDVLEEGQGDQRSGSGSGGRGRIPALLLLTDGCPNIHPPRGELEMLKKYREKSEGTLPGIVNTFGFGYSLDSGLLNELAVEGNGVYSFIPDGSFVGTTFIHAAANLLTSMVRNVLVSLEPLNGAEIVIPTPTNPNTPQTTPNPLLGRHHCQPTSWGVQLELGTLQYGQSTDLIVRLKSMPPVGTPYLNVTVKWAKPGTNSSDHEYQTYTFEGTSQSLTTPEEASEIRTHLRRLTFAETVQTAMSLVVRDTTEPGQQLISSFITNTLKSSTSSAFPPSLATFPPTPDETQSLQSLLQDCEGQVTEAFIPAYYRKWGRHYLPSLASAHLLQRCNNFKDPGVQVYASKSTLFKQLRDKFDDMFCSLPPPTPSVRRSAPSYSYGASAVGGGSVASAAPARSMRSYHNSSNPCFDGECFVEMADGSKKKVKDLRKGDRVRTGSPLLPYHKPTSSSSQSSSKCEAEIVCVIKTPCSTGFADLVSLPSGLFVTPWHPIRLSSPSPSTSPWCFPHTISAPTRHPCPAVYTFILSHTHVLIINGVECVTLGHGVTSADVDA
ncbi:hypothetical protein HK102_013684, partial [Quaeritorhiza haematococci]